MTELEPPEVFGLLADPLRWRLLAELDRSDLRVGELVERVGKPQNLVSYHLAELRRVGAVTSRRSSADGRDVYYTAELERCHDLVVGGARSLFPAALGGPLPTLPRRPRRKVLFLCSGNSARSQIAEALTTHLSEGAVEARSAGSHPKPLHPDAVRVLAERGIDIASRRSKSLDRFTGTRFDRIVTMCDKVREVCPEFPGSPVTIHWSLADPSVDPAGYNAFVRTAEVIERRVRELLRRLALDAAAPRHPADPSAPDEQGAQP